MKQSTKDHLWSALSGAVFGVGVVAGTVVVGTAAVGVVGVVGTAAAVGVVGVVGAAVGVVGADKAKEVRPLSASFGAALSLAMSFGLASHFGLLSGAPDTQPVQTPETIEKPAFQQQKGRDVAAAFNATNDNKQVTASINDNGQCVLMLTGSPQKTYNPS